MSSKSGGHDAGIRGRGGHSKAFDASCLNLSSDEIFCQNSVGAAVCSKDGGRSCAEEEKDLTKSDFISKKLEETSFNEAKRGQEGLFSKVERQPNRGLKEKGADSKNSMEKKRKIMRFFLRIE